MRATLTRTEVSVGRESRGRSAGRSGSRSAPRWQEFSPRLWSRRENAVLAIVGGLCVAGLALCWKAVADETWWRDQLGVAKVGALFTGLFVLVVLGWIVLGMRRLRAGLRELAARRREAYGLGPSVELSVGDVLATSTELVMAGSMTRAHRPSCLLLRGKSVQPVPAAQAAEYPRCGVCRS